MRKKMARKLGAFRSGEKEAGTRVERQEEGL